jgi:vacuolar-type H+-ATPase subunit H
MSTGELVSLFASFASLILAVVAIWLSIVFFKLSSKLSESTTEAAKGIGSSVERLEKLFDKLYSDTFSMMRDTVSDMRKHIWPTEPTGDDQLAEEAERKADEKIEELKKSVSDELATVLQRQRVADEKLQSFRAEMNHLIDRVIVSSRQVDVEAREETLRAAILRSLRLLQRRHRRVSASDLVERLMPEAPGHKVVEELMKMRDEGLLTLSEDPVGPDTIIGLSRVGRPKETD